MQNVAFIKTIVPATVIGLDGFFALVMFWFFGEGAGEWCVCINKHFGWHGMGWGGNLNFAINMIIQKDGTGIIKS